MNMDVVTNGLGNWQICLVWVTYHNSNKGCKVHSGQLTFSISTPSHSDFSHTPYSLLLGGFSLGLALQSILNLCYSAHFRNWHARQVSTSRFVSATCVNQVVVLIRIDCSNNLNLTLQMLSKIDLQSKRSLIWVGSCTSALDFTRWKCDLLGHCTSRKRVVRHTKNIFKSKTWMDIDHFLPQLIG